MFRLLHVFICFIIIFSFNFAHAREFANQSYTISKIGLERIYFALENPKTLYCDAEFDTEKNINLPVGFEVEKHVNRAKRVEWEHVVPAENFGRNFVEWREGHPLCVDSKGKAYKGRRCAEKTNEEYRIMQADMYNLYPTIGAVNALRSNFNFAMLPNDDVDFGVCQMKIENRNVEPPESARGKIARAYMYMEETYPRYSMNNQQRQLMRAWNQQYPITEEECLRAKEIKKIQGNTNYILENLCAEKQGHIQYGLVE